MKPNSSFTRQRGFTLMETVIAIGVLSVLLTGFMIVFIPAADGIKKSISIQDADRLVAALEQELVTTRSGAEPEPPVDETLTGFDRARQRIKYSTGPITANQDTYAGSHIDKALLAYQYRGNPSSLRPDGTPAPVKAVTGKVGQDYILVPMLRRKDSANFLEDLLAVEGPVFLVKCVQMVHEAGGALRPLPSGNKQRGRIYNPAPGADDTEIQDEEAYPDAVIAFAAEFYTSPSKAEGFFRGDAFTSYYEGAVKPTFTRNLAVRR